MKLLIVDDEILTRNGLISSIQWANLGIDNVYEASDGLEGLEMATVHKPEIILSDVRMPRMNGIDMLYKVRELLPDTVFIFMSGYSDKEYLKAAIKLRAVNYVEKPLDLTEIEQAVRSAAERHLQIVESRQSQDLRKDHSAAQLALALTHPYPSMPDSVNNLADDYCRKYGDDNVFRAAVTLIVQMPENLELPLGYIKKAGTQLHDMIRPLHLHVICAEKKTNLFVFHLFRKRDITPQLLLSVQSYLKEIFTPHKNFHFAVGIPVSGIRRLYDSYSSAVPALQSAFFFPPGTCMSPEHSEITVARKLPDQFTDKFAAALGQANQNETERLSSRLYDHCAENRSLLPRSVTSLYYQLFSLVSEERRRQHITGNGSAMTGDAILEHVEHFFFYQDLHQSFLDIVEGFFRDLNSAEPESSAVYLIKSYIQRHYGNPLLSTKEISEYASLSASYACTVFKNETGQTLNQYLTEYRLNKARELLNDPRNTVSVVSAMVGYSDSNYFSKAFKKYTGIAPSAYRERRLK